MFLIPLQDQIAVSLRYHWVYTGRQNNLTEYQNFPFYEIEPTHCFATTYRERNPTQKIKKVNTLIV